MAVESVRFGVGTFTLGTDPGHRFSCQVQSMGVNIDVDEGDTITVLCGDQVPGSRTLHVHPGGDGAAGPGRGVRAGGVHVGERRAPSRTFTFAPNTTATTSIAGKVSSTRFRSAPATESSGMC